MSTNCAHRVHWVCIQKQQRWLGTDRTAASSQAGHTLGQSPLRFPIPRCLGRRGSGGGAVRVSGQGSKAKSTPGITFPSRASPWQAWTLCWLWKARALVS